MNRIFVYGLLKPGFSLYHVAEPFVIDTIDATVKGRLYDAGVPAARFDEDGEIEGAILTLDETRVDEALRVLDELEEEGREYRRITVEARTRDGVVDAHAYEYLLSLAGRRDVGRSWSDRQEPR
jgi:gamma-glutamylcyclotransferase (GGCT)/AIG2-like uncharacterized protein YtfP